MKLRISRRAREIQASPIRKLVPHAQAAKDKGKKIYHLNIGQPDIETPDLMMKAIRKFKDPVLGYGPSQGMPEYINTLVNYYNRKNFNISKEHVIICTGGSEAILFAFMAVGDFGDEVIIPEPFYTNYNSFATQVGLKVVPITTYAEDGFHLPPSDRIAEKITPRTKAILICNPNNPTGTVYTRDELAMVIGLAMKYKLFVIADEVYREFIYDGLKHISVMEFKEAEQHLIMCDSISKRFSACGARIGVFISKNEELMACVMKFAQGRLCPPTLEQVGAVALHTLGESYYRRVNEEYQKRRDIVYDALSRIPGVVCRKPQGAFYVIAKLPVNDAEHYALWLLTDFDSGGESVMVAPAQGFYASPEFGLDEIRIAYVLNSDKLTRAMEILAESLTRYKGVKSAPREAEWTSST
ncbi:MAG: pyridoxal phosphate-dependent aminotransferase [Candidatus Wallbacteria bacterium]|nr:pyridoxal phosphate-dependent aminotransferase [Candidatus Wallbacteria bacterium]